MNIPLSPCVPENLVSRDGFSRPVPRQPAHLHTQAESRAYLRDSSRVPRRRPFMKPPHAIGSVPSLSGHAIAYRWRPLPRVRRHRASKRARNLDDQSRRTQDNAVRLSHVESARVSLRYAAPSPSQLLDSLHRLAKEHSRRPPDFTASEREHRGDFMQVGFCSRDLWRGWRIRDCQRT